MIELFAVACIAFALYLGIKDAVAVRDAVARDEDKD